MNWFKAMDVNAPLPPRGTLDTLSDAELYVALDAVALYRDTKRLELPSDEARRDPFDPCTTPLEAHTLDWQLLQAGSLATRFYIELCRRDPSLLEMAK